MSHAVGASGQNVRQCTRSAMHLNVVQFAHLLVIAIPVRGHTSAHPLAGTRSHRNI